MMPKKKSPPVDLDFSEIGSMERTMEEEKYGKPPKKEAPPPRVKKDKFAEIVLSIPAKGEQSKFISRTIGECSGLEFTKWANNVAYPLEQNKEYYDSVNNRKREFVKILTFHRKNFIIANPDAIKTLH